MTRERILLILGAVGVVGVLLAVALWLGGGEEAEAEPTPSPAVTIDTGITPEPLPTDPAVPVEVPGEEGEHFEGDGHDHSHDHGVVEDCTSGPVACGEDQAEAPVIRNTAEDVAALAAVRPKVAPFVLEWARVQTNEAAGARAARLAGAGASAAVAAQPSALARADSAQIGLIADTVPQPGPRVLSIGREDGLLKFQVAMNVDAKYSFPDDSGSWRVVGGTMHVYLSDAGAIEKVVENFPTLDEMR
jgi:hypothetical protein